MKDFRLRAALSTNYLAIRKTEEEPLTQPLDLKSQIVALISTAVVLFSATAGAGDAGRS